ncbi:BMP family ABC transporter substrate-binding protein [Haloarcula mannanilytica]|uniref:BMP family ABC transporter substrate-binding protein n=2 Tax=Haloarcula mannanilytica TaxID=2509225 RepID=A0A4C2EH56_9EURY|nr:BMP family ABC transporter substrate-binding protein [Haloarcula mannanilytica]
MWLICDTEVFNAYPHRWWDMSQRRRTFLSSVGTATAIGVAGCLGGGDGSSGDGGDTDGNGSDGGDGDSGPAARIGMVYATGGLGDGSFNDQAQTGVIRAEEELNIAYDESQPEAVQDFASLQQQYAQSSNPNYDLVCCIGFLQADALTENASQYPEQNFMIVDSTVDADNVGSYVFGEHQGSFLVGLMAARLSSQDFSAGAGSTQSDSTNVGFVGGVEGDLIGRFEAGYKAGVKHANEDIDIQTAYVGDFNDPSGGQEAALSMYNSGADIVYHAAGNTGTGVFRAAQEAGRFAIGVDRDQSVTKENFSDIILASMVKRVDNAVYTSIESVINDNFEGGTVNTLGLEQNGVEAVYGQQLGSEIPQAVKDEVSEVRQSIIDGDISVPTDPGNV